MPTPFDSFIASPLPAPGYGVSLRRMDQGVQDVQPGETAFRHYPTDAELTAAGFKLKAKPLPVAAVYQAIAALAPAQMLRVWADLTSGSPPKIATDGGTSSGLLLTLWRRVMNETTLPAATIADLKIQAAAFYTMDHPSYLLGPSFDPTINVPTVG